MDYSTYTDQNEKVIKDAVNLKRLITGSSIDLAASGKLTKFNPIATVLTAMVNMFNGLQERAENNKNHDKQVDKQRNEK